MPPRRLPMGRYRGGRLVGDQVSVCSAVDEVGPDGQWWCTCPQRPGPHVHCIWGPGLHIHDVDPETGQEVTW
jgi:hypothetical protein